MQIQSRVGQQFGNYRLIRLIGKGGYAEVYLAENIKVSNLQYAIKVLTETNLRDYQREEFLSEARTIASLQLLNSHIVQIYDFGIQVSKDGTERDTPYFVMEFAREGTLRSLYPRGAQVPLERIVFYINQVAEALQCAHGQVPPVVHRDIKPENMLLRSLDHILLSDFGIAITGKTGYLVKPAGETGVVGTATYLAPERFSGHTRRASDQYSLGIVAYEWLCGHPPFDGEDLEICRKQIMEEPQHLYPIYSHITKEIDDVVMRALRKNPEDRYPSVQDFARAIEVAFHASPQQGGQIWQLIGNGGGQQGNNAGMHGGQPGNQPDQQQVIIPSPDLLGTTKKLIVKQNQQEIYPYPNLFGSAGSQSTQQNQQSWQVAVPPTRPIRPPMKKLRDFFDFSPQFAMDRRFSLFRDSGIVLNILSAMIIVLILHNVYALFGGLLGLIFSLLMFALCVRAVEETLAMFFGTLVALYWGGVGWVIGSFITSFLHLNGLLASVFTSLIFFSISFGLHVWYVSRKNL